MIRVAMHPLTPTGVGSRIGFVRIEDTRAGLRLTPELHNLARYGIRPGPHGFHIHEMGDLAPTIKDGRVVRGGSAGGHYDPERTGRHAGPYGDGHRGDLPVLQVAANGSATRPVVAPRLKLSEVEGRAIIIHLGGDNYTDTPPNGGGKARMIGGVITNDCPYCKKKGGKSGLLALAGSMAVIGGFYHWYNSNEDGS